MQHHTAAEPDQQLYGDLGEEQPRSPGRESDADRAEQDPHSTSNDVTHLVCRTPGRFGAMIRHG